MKYFFIKLINVVSSFFRSISLFFVSVVTIIVSFLLFTKLEQGQDVLIQVTESLYSRIFSVMGLFIFSFSLWYGGRLLSYKKLENTTDETMIRFLEHFPRLMAFFAFLSIQIAFLSLPTVAELLGTYSVHIRVIIFALNITLYFLINSQCAAIGKTKRTQTIFIIVIAFLNLLLWSYIFKQGHASKIDHLNYIPFYCITLFTFMVLSEYGFVGRRRSKIINASGEQVSSHYINVFGQRLNTGEINESRYYLIFNVTAILGVFGFFIAIKWGGIAILYGPLACVLFGLGFLVLVSNLISFFSIRWHINLFVLIFIMLMFIGKTSDPYKVQLIPSKNTRNYDKRPELVQYFRNWVMANVRYDRMDKEGNFAVYVILADGGASRSGYWVASVLSAIEDRTPTNNRFSSHILAISSASGGSVGNATFYSLLKRRIIAGYLDSTRKFLGNDFLSPLLCHLLGPDIWGHFGIFRDRGWALEEAMDRESGANSFGRPVSDYLDTNCSLPILFLNTTEVQRGQPGVISSVQLQQFSSRIDVLKLVDDSCSNHNIKLSSAAILSSRFPYISPAGNIGNMYFVDGGYFDNSGAGVANEMMFIIDSLITRDTTMPLYKHLKFHLVHITNNEVKVADITPISSIANNLAAPILTVLNTYGSQTDVNDARLRKYFVNGHKQIDSNINLFENETDVYPMNWVISKYNLGRMNERLDRQIDKLKKQHLYGL